MVVALCRDVVVWQLVAGVMDKGFYLMPYSDVLRAVQSSPTQRDSASCPEHLHLSSVWAMKGWGMAWGGVEDAGEGTRCRTMASKLCPELPAPGALHDLVTT